MKKVLQMIEVAAWVVVLLAVSLACGAYMKMLVNRPDVSSCDSLSALPWLQCEEGRR